MSTRDGSLDEREDHPKPVVYVTQPVHPDGFALLQEHAQVHVGFGPDAEPIESVLPRIEGFLVRYMGISADEIERAPALRAVVRAGAGYERIAVGAAKARGIPVLIAAEANSRTVAEHVFAMALAVYREIPKWDRLTRAGGAHLRVLREQQLSRDLSGKRLGVVGMGRIGAEVARIGRDGFLMDVLAYHPRRPDEEIRARGATPTHSLAELLGQVDIVSIQLPLTDETRGMFGAEQFRQMTSDSVLINVSRGGVVDEIALARALESGTIAGAGIDVWEGQVPSSDHPLLRLDNVVASPHRAGRTEEAQRRMGMSAVQALLDTLAGRDPVGVVDVTR